MAANGLADVAGRLQQARSALAGCPSSVPGSPGSGSSTRLHSSVHSFDSSASRRAGAGRHPKSRNRRPRGFTLIEILVVVVILGILAAIVVPKVMEHPGEARQVRAKQDIQAIATALNMYKLDNFTYPSTEQGLAALVSKPSGTPEAPNWKKGGYLEKQQAPKDPWGRPYLYLHPGSHGDVDVFSYGADGKPGGDGEDADVGNWD